MQTTDGGYAIAGHKDFWYEGKSDVWLIKTDSTGNMLWNQTYGGTGYEYGQCIVEAADGGYVIAGYTSDDGRNVDFCLVKTLVESDLAWTATNSTANTITLYRGATDTYWNYVRVQIWTKD